MRPISLKSIISILAILSMIVVASGCAANAKHMIPCDYEVSSQQPYTVSVNESTGGIDPKPLWSSQISDAEFTIALTDSLKKSGVFQYVTTGSNNADYILDVKILSYDQPWNGADMKVSIETRWKLSDAKTKQVVWSEKFPSYYKAVWISALTDTQRIKKAHEGAVRNCIREGIRRISLLNL